MLASKQRCNTGSGFFRVVSVVLLSLYISFFTSFTEAQTRATGSQLRILTNLQTGTSYTVSTTDCGKLLSFSNSSAITVSLPEAGASGLAAGCWLEIQNTGSGTLTLTPNQSTIDGAIFVELLTNQGLRLVSTGANYLSERGQSGSGIGNCTLTGTNDDQLTCSSVSTDDSSQSGQILLYDLEPGIANYFSWAAPSLIPASYTLQLPASQPNGQVMQFNALSQPGSIATSQWVTLGPLATQASVLPSQLPLPTASTPGGVQSIDCSPTGTVQKINTDGSVDCAAAATGGGAVTSTLDLGAGGYNMNGAGYYPSWNNTASGGAQVGGLAYMQYGNSGSPYNTKVFYWPSNWDNTTAVNVMLAWYPQTGGGNVVFDASFSCLSGNSTTVTFNTATAMTPVVSVGGLVYTTIWNVNTSGCVAGQLGVIKLLRDTTVPGNSSDTIDVIDVAIQWTSH